MIWLHCGDATQVSTTVSLAERLAGHNDRIRLLITAEPVGLFDGIDLPPSCTAVEAPAESPTKTRSFLDEWQPSSMIWIGGTLRRTLLRVMAKTRLPATLVNASSQHLFGRRFNWLTLPNRSALAHFDRILAADGATATRLIRGGMDSRKVAVTGPIMEDPMPLLHDRNELTVMAEAVGTRPVWLAADVTAQEVSHMAAAHLAACRKSHRLLLLIAPRGIDDGPQVARILRDHGLAVGLRSDGDDPEEEQQAYVTDFPSESGLWYRLSPLTFMGGTFSGDSALSPLDPIVLGSAIIHGPKKAPHQAQYERLAKAEACREVRTAGELGIAIGTLVSPEHSARMALAGWEEITRNAEHINALVQDALRTEEEAAHA